jgi:hypothetical protein
MQSNSKVLVLILTWCKDPDALYGSLLTLKTIRIGFPDADVMVVDNGSIDVPDIRLAAEAVGAGYMKQNEVPHWQFMRKAIEIVRQPLVFADPDLIFWDRMKMPETLIAGRLIPQFFDEYTQTLTHARLHTSLLSIPDPQKLWQVIRAEESRMWESDLLRPIMLPSNGKWERWDTGAPLYGAIGGHAFTTELDSYDHIFCGSHLKYVAEKLNPTARSEFKRVHDIARTGDLSKLRGIWKLQEQYFKDRYADRYGVVGLDMLSSNTATTGSVS